MPYSNTYIYNWNDIYFALYSLLVLSVAYLVPVFATSLDWLFISRLIAGFASATYVSAYAYITDITPICPTASAGCNPSNTTASGEGLEKHVYKGILDFNTTPLSSFASCSGNVIVGASINVRNSAITTGPSGTTLYNDVEIDLQKAPTNSSPQFTNDAVGIFCCNQPFFYNLGASDTSDLDSLSYRFANLVK